MKLVPFILAALMMLFMSSTLRAHAHEGCTGPDCRVVSVPLLR